MNILPVLDLLNGEIVRGVAGKRETYRPVTSRLTDSAAPLAVAEAFRKHLGLSQLYLADLDAILHGQPDYELVNRLAERDFSLLVDAGLTSLSAVQQVLAAGASAAVIGLETLPAPELLPELVAACGADRIVFSLDLKSGQPLTTLPAWQNAAPLDIARHACRSGITRLIVLDLAQVGMQQGLSTLDLCRAIYHEFPQVQLTTGGGIQHAADLAPLAGEPVAGLLVATALHTGAITREDVARYCAQ